MLGLNYRFYCNRDVHLFQFTVVVMGDQDWLEGTTSTSLFELSEFGQMP